MLEVRSLEMPDLAGRRAVITGATHGIGHAIALGLARSGVDVASMSLPDHEDRDHLTSEIEAEGVRSLTLEGNTGDANQVQSLADHVIANWGGIDIWINNAARLQVRRFVDIEDRDWHGLLAANLHGYFYGCRAAARHMSARGGGCILNITSITDVQPTTGLAAYTTAKGAIVAMTKVLALELGSVGVRVNALAPGATETSLNAGAWTDDVRSVYRERIAIGRIAEPSDIADVALFLVSDAARYITGQEVLADGGMTINGDVGHAAT